jgi:uncharacterized membrane protein YeaQ/YmgE (transglycosylase-associated protein family)
LIEWIQPVWILLVITGCFWASAYSAMIPPPFRAVFWVFVAGIIGAFVGQYGAETASVPDLMFGDTHLIAASIVSLLTVVVVRRLVA